MGVPSLPFPHHLGLNVRCDPQVKLIHSPHRFVLGGQPKREEKGQIIEVWAFWANYKFSTFTSCTHPWHPPRSCSCCSGKQSTSTRYILYAGEYGKARLKWQLKVHYQNMFNNSTPKKKVPLQGPQSGSRKEAGLCICGVVWLWYWTCLFSLCYSCSINLSMFT